MLSAIGSMLSKTIDVFLKINSAEGRRRRFAKDVFAVYNSLDEIVQALDAIAVTVKDVAGLNESKDSSIFDRGPMPEYLLETSRSSDGTVELQTYYLGDDGTERLSPKKRVKFDDMLAAVLSNDIRRLNRAIGKLARIMEAESWDLFQLQHQPEKLKALGIFDDNLISTFTRAWFADGGFVEALHHLRLDQELDGKVLKLVDAEFQPRTSPNGYDVDGHETEFSLENGDDALAFLELTTKCKSSVAEARDAVKKFIAKNCAIEDIL